MGRWARARARARARAIYLKRLYQEFIKESIQLRISLNKNCLRSHMTSMRRSLPILSSS